MKTIKLKTYTQNPDNPQKYGDAEIAELVASIRKEPRTLGAAKIAFCTDYTATNGASYAGRRVVIAGNKRLQALQEIARAGGLRDPGDADAWLVSPQGDAPAAWFFDLTPLGPDARRHWLLESNIGRGEWDAEKLLAQFTRDELSGHFDDLDELLGEMDAGDDDATPTTETPAAETSGEMPEGVDEDNPEYQAFLDKFKPKKTTDDCYTPKPVYDAVLQWATKEYNLDGREVIRPFWPGGDYQAQEYPPGCVVVDNPPFSILSQIVAWFNERKIDYFLFSPYLTNLGTQGCNHVISAHSVTYANGARVDTSFVTNMGEWFIRSAPDLMEAIREADEKNRNAETRKLPKYSYPASVVTSAAIGYLCKHHVDFRLRREECAFTRGLDAQGKGGGHIWLWVHNFGSGDGAPQGGRECGAGQCPGGVPASRGQCARPHLGKSGQNHTHPRVRAIPARA
ncbi:MAG: hypothetical protein J6V72_05305 [Kiritimatiellae bacterium]|nr:hypothetical protein [Kiritimatiellia bacterium]